MDRRKLAELDATPDPNDNAERLLTHIVRGVPEGRSDTVKTQANRDLWDAIVRDLASPRARGKTVGYGTSREAKEDPPAG